MKISKHKIWLLKICFKLIELVSYTIPRKVITTRITHIIVENTFNEEKCRLVQVLKQICKHQKLAAM